MNHAVPRTSLYPNPRPSSSAGQDADQWPLASVVAIVARCHRRSQNSRFFFSISRKPIFVYIYIVPPPLSPSFSPAAFIKIYRLSQSGRHSEVWQGLRMA
jgi:hypothetical protein